MTKALLSEATLRARLEAMDGRAYPAYKQLRGAWRLTADARPWAPAPGDTPGTGVSQAIELPFELHIDHVQGDPFAAPSRVRLRLAQEHAGFPPSTWQPAARRRALESWLALRLAAAIDAGPGSHVSDRGNGDARTYGDAGARRGSGGSGRIDIDRPGQQVLERTCVRVGAEAIEVRCLVGLPAVGRRILGDAAVDLLCRRLPALVAAGLRYSRDVADDIDAWTHTVEDAVALRAQLRSRGLVAFVADDAVLPRRSGVDDGPLTQGPVVPFASPLSLRVELRAPHAGTVTGMGVPAGVTLIVGGGFHGKSTLLAALERGVYDHRPGDGRQRVVTDADAVKVRAEDGRRVEGVDLSPFIGALPYGRDTACFRTDDASGSTSQAAAIVEALEAGARALLVDEDTAATNFMIRDGRMQRLIADAAEPITPFLDRVRQLYDERGVSTILVMGGSGDYFEVADTVIAMQDYAPRDVTTRARDIAAEHGSDRRRQTLAPLDRTVPRCPQPDSVDARRGRRQTHWKVRGPRHLELGRQTVDLGAVTQLVDASQTRAIAAALVHAQRHHIDGDTPLPRVLDAVLADIEAGGLDALDDHPAGDRAAFRRFELAAALNRLRSLRVDAPAKAGA